MKYSRKQFDGYKYRAVFESDITNEYQSFHIYTEETDKTKVFDYINSKLLIKIPLRISLWVSKEEDDRKSELIEQNLFI